MPKRSSSPRRSRPRTQTKPTASPKTAPKAGAHVSAEDRAAIEDTVARLAHAYSDGDVARLVPLFTEDAVFESGYSGIVGSRIDGRDSLEKFFKDLYGLYWTTKCSRVWTANLIVEGRSGAAQASCFFNRLSILGDSISTGIWTLGLRRSGERWRISLFQMMVDGSREEFAARQALALARTKGRTAESA